MNAEEFIDYAALDIALLEYDEGGLLGIDKRLLEKALDKYANHKMELAMPDNGRKEFPVSGLEQDVCSAGARRIYCYLRNRSGVKKFTKRKMNKRFRKRGKSRLRDY